MCVIYRPQSTAHKILVRKIDLFNFSKFLVEPDPSQRRENESTKATREKTVDFCDVKNT